jgi:hypothetical protein
VCLVTYPKNNHTLGLTGCIHSSHSCKEIGELVDWVNRKKRRNRRKRRRHKVRRQTTEDRRQMTEDRDQKSEVRGKTTENNFEMRIADLGKHEDQPLALLPARRTCRSEAELRTDQSKTTLPEQS